MINYWPLKYEKSQSDRLRTIQGLQAIRQLIRDCMPRRLVHDTLILGTWNIRNFDDNRFGDGPRLEESLYYIAEVISAFDIIAVQEICRDLKPWEKIMKRLENHYDMITTDVTEGPSGNAERLLFVYNTHKVWFRKMAGEIVLPFTQQISDVTQKRQFARTPFSCAFQAGWFPFVLSTVHIYYGNQSQTSPEYQRRVKEIETIAKFLKDRAINEKDNYILVGDFNIDKIGDPAYNALEHQGFEIVKNNIGSNSKRTKFYDQISWIPRDGALRQTPSDRNQGVLNVFDTVFKDNDFPVYKSSVIKSLNLKLENAKTELQKATQSGKTKEIKAATESINELESLLNDPVKLKEYYMNTWRTFQISDHLPLWVELDIDFSEPYLERLKTWTNPV